MGRVVFIFERLRNKHFLHAVEAAQETALPEVEPEIIEVFSIFEAVHVVGRCQDEVGSDEKACPQPQSCLGILKGDGSNEAVGEVSEQTGIDFLGVLVIEGKFIFVDVLGLLGSAISHMRQSVLIIYTYFSIFR